MQSITSKVLSRRLLALACAAILACAMLCFAGCSSPSGEADDKEPSAGEGGAQITVTVEVDATAMEGGTKEAAQSAVAEGATVMDALEASGLDYVSENGDYGVYITSILGFEAESNGGWVYSVNGESGVTAADAAVVADGDTVTWEYVTF